MKKHLGVMKVEELNIKRSFPMILKRKNILKILFIFFTILSVFKSIFTGMDIDEAYCIALGRQIAQGGLIIRDIWSEHITSALIYAPFLFLYEKITGSSQGIILYWRIVGIAVHAFISFALYRTVRKYFNKTAAFYCALLYFLFLPKWICSPEYTLMAYWFTMSIALCLFNYFKQPTKLHLLILAGIFQALCVLAYPTMILLFPLYLVLLYRGDRHSLHDGGVPLKACRDKGKRDLLIFSAVCLLGAVLFVLYAVFSIGLDTFFQNAIQIFKGENHQGSYSGKLINITVQLLGLTVVAYLPIIGLKLFGKFIRFSDVTVLTVYLILVTFISHVIRFQSINQFRMVYTVIIVGLWTPYFYFKYGGDDCKNIIRLFWIPGLVMMFAIQLGTNLKSIAVSGTGMLLGSVGAFLMMCGKDGEETAKSNRVLCAVLCVCLLFTQSMFVRTISTYDYVFDKKYFIKEGPAKYLRVNQRYFDSYVKLGELVKEYVTKQDKLLLISADASGYLMTDAEMATFQPSFIPPATKRLDEFFSLNPNKVPSIVIIDMTFIKKDLEEYYSEMPAGKYIAQNYDIENAIYADRFVVVRKR